MTTLLQLGVHMGLEMNQGLNTNLWDTVMVILCLLKSFLCYLDLSIAVLDERLKMVHLLAKIQQYNLIEFNELAHFSKKKKL